MALFVVSHVWQGGAVIEKRLWQPRNAQLPLGQKQWHEMLSSAHVSKKPCFKAAQQ